MKKLKFWPVTVKNARDLNFEARDKWIKVVGLDDVIMTKAEVIGVAGIYCLEDERSEEREMTVKKVSPTEWKKLG